MRCRTAQKLVIAASDDELAPWRRRWLDRHLAGCERCRREQVSSARVLEALEGLGFEEGMPPRLEQNVLRSVRKLAAADVEPRAAGFGRLRAGVPMLATGAVALLAVILGRGVVGPPGRPDATTAGDGAVAQGSAQGSKEPAGRRTVARGTRTQVPAEPPAALAARPELFMDLPILRNMEKLQHFDAIATMDADDGAAPEDAWAPSNG